MTIKGDNKMMSADDRSVKTKGSKKTPALRVYRFAGGHTEEATSYKEALENYQKITKDKE